MQRIVCQWCDEENEPGRTHCVNCGAQLHIKDLVGEPVTQHMAPPPLPFDMGSAVATPLPTFAPSRRRGAGGVLGSLVFMILIAGGIGTLVYHNAHSTHRSASTTSKPKPQPFTPDGLNRLLTEIRNHFGDTMGYELSFDFDSASILRADPTNNRHAQYYFYNVAGDWSSGPSETVPSDKAVADLSKFDVTAVTAKLAGAAQSLGMTDVEHTYVMIDGVADGNLKLQIQVSGTGGSGSVDLNPDGTVKALHPPS